MSSPSLRRLSALGATTALLVALGTAPVSAAGANSVEVDTLSDTGPGCTLRDAIIATNNDSNEGDCTGVNVNTDLIEFTVSGTITLGSDLPDITDDVTIDGGEVITIDGDGSYRPFFIDGATVVLDGLEITGGYADYGGGIYNDGGDLTVVNSDVHDNEADGGDGGGIYNDGTLTVTDSTISNNDAEFLGGGIMHAALQGLTITDSTIEDNDAGDDGGGIYTYGPADVMVTDSTISGNRAYGDGGGIWMNDGTLTVTGSTISENRAELLGGGIFSTDDVTVEDSQVSANEALVFGGIFVSGTGSITGSTISDNTAEEGGGGIGVDFESTATIIGSTISGNATRGNGGGIWNAGELAITDSAISGNEAGQGGGGIANLPAPDDSPTADTPTLPAGSVVVTGSTINDNVADVHGGGIQNWGAATIVNSTIADNTAGDGEGGDGGGIHNQGGTLIVANVTITGNEAIEGGGGGIYSFEGTFDLLNSIVAGNTADGDEDIDGTPDTDTNNLIGTGALTLADILDPAGLADNGGPTMTIALVDDETNPAIGGGDDATCAAAPVDGVDQRGYDRDDGDGLYPGCDIGAYELQGAAPTDPPTAMTPGTTGEGSAPLLPVILVILASGLLVLTGSRLPVRRR